jgi:thioredoxin-related protein
MKLIFILLIGAPLNVLAQAIGNYAVSNDKGIKFERNINWDQLKLKAKKENKYIFLDCFTTWCRPCEEMDKYVYTDSQVADYFNQNFISFKLQMDSSDLDGEEIRDWRQTARKIQNDYKVWSFPTYLFFSPEGKIVHRDVGIKSSENFISLGRDALKPERQYYSLLASYNRGERDYLKMPYLANYSLAIGDREVGEEIGSEYINSYLINMGNEVFTKENLFFLSYFTQSSKDKGFKIFYQSAKKVNAITGSKSFAETVVDNIIIKEEILPHVVDAAKNSASPNWTEIELMITKKYKRSYAKRTIIDEKIEWYKSQKNWSGYTKYLVKRVEKYGPIGVGILDFDLNNNAWEVFKYSRRKYELTKALSWSEKAIEMNNDNSKANWMDTKANLLYKLGKIEEAILLEGKVVSMEPKSENFKNNLAYMKMRKPTWLLY